MEPVYEAVLSQLFGIAVKATVLIAVTMVLAQLWRSPSARALLWAAVLGSLLFLPLAATWRIGPEIHWPASRDQVGNHSNVVLEVSRATDPPVSAESAAHSVPWTTVVLGLYLAGVAKNMVAQGPGVDETGLAQPRPKSRPPPRQAPEQACLEGLQEPVPACLRRGLAPERARLDGVIARGSPHRRARGNQSRNGEDAQKDRQKDQTER